MGYCHVGRQCDDYAQKIGVEEAKEIAFEAMVKSLTGIGEEFDPLEVNNFAEGFSEISNKDLAIICGLIRLEQYEQATRLLESHINAHWEKLAKQEIMRGKQ